MDDFDDDDLPPQFPLLLWISIAYWILGGASLIAIGIAWMIGTPWSKLWARDDRAILWYTAVIIALLLLSGLFLLVTGLWLRLGRSAPLLSAACLSLAVGTVTIVLSADLYSNVPQSLYAIPIGFGFVMSFAIAVLARKPWRQWHAERQAADSLP